jgi:outer membrane protein
VKREWMLAVAATVALVAGAVEAQAAEAKIGVVNYSRLLQESPHAKAAQEALRNEFAGKQREIQTLQASLKAKEDKLAKDGATMTADQRTKAEKELRDGNRDYQAKATEYQEDINARQNEELSKLQAELVGVVQQYAAAQKFDLVLADGVIYANSALDITAAVLATLPSVAAKPAASAPPKAPAGK